MSENVKLAFTGDIFFGQGELDIAKDVIEILGQADCVVANLESPITSCPKIDSAKILLGSKCGCEEKLHQWGVKLVSLANNHTCDHGADGLAETINRLDTAGISHVGAGCNLKSAAKPVIIEIKKVKLGFLSYAWEGTQATYATEEQFGCAPLEEQFVISKIQELKTQVDHVIVMPHWGYCDFVCPTDFNVKLGEKMLDAGASAVVGHHSHILHGCRKRIDNKFIAYSLGDFLFAPYAHMGHITKSKGENSQGAVLVLSFNSSEITDVQWHFTCNKDGLIKLDNRTQREKEFQLRCQAVANIEEYPAFWKKQVKKRMRKRCFFWLNPINWRRLKWATFQSLGIMLIEAFRRKKKAT